MPAPYTKAELADTCVIDKPLSQTHVKTIQYRWMRWETFLFLYRAASQLRFMDTLNILTMLYKGQSIFLIQVDTVSILRYNK